MLELPLLCFVLSNVCYYPRETYHTVERICKHLAESFRAIRQTSKSHLVLSLEEREMITRKHPTWGGLRERCRVGVSPGWDTYVDAGGKSLKIRSWPFWTELRRDVFIHNLVNLWNAPWASKTRPSKLRKVPTELQVKLIYLLAR